MRICGDIPLGPVQVELGPFGLPQLAGPNERKRCQSEGAAGRQVAPVAVDRAEQRADGLGVGDRRVVLLLDRR